MGHLTDEQRYTIEVMLKRGCKQNFIASTLNKDKSVISREIARNSDLRNKEYRSALAIRKTEQRKKTKAKKTKLTEDVRQYIDEKLRLRWSPEQISKTASIYGDKMVSHERIYQYIISDKKQGGDLCKCLRRKKKYKKRLVKDTRGKINNQKNISQRPEVVNEKTRVGDLEIDLIIGANHKGAIVTATDRKTGYNWMAKVPNKESATVAVALKKLFMPFKTQIHTMTADNGKEFADHESVSKGIEVDFYFADPYSSWQRGANENFNGLVRDYFPKKTNFAKITEEELLKVSDELNKRPRKRLGFKSPIQVHDFLTEKVAFKT
jgi:transposase, IS30 family